MSHKVVISYATEDAEVATAICSALERNDIPCWIAPRDIRPGTKYAPAIIDAIDSAHILIIVLSASSNDSQFVELEVEAAVRKRVRLVPFRIENITPSKSLELFMYVTQWMDAWSGPINGHLEALVNIIRLYLPSGESGRSILKPSPTSREALVQYKEGVRHYNLTSKDDMIWAEEYFRKALVLDPNLSMAYVGLADVDVFRYMSYFDRTTEALGRAKQQCEIALRIDPACAQAYRTLGRIAMTERRFEAAKQNLLKAIAINPAFLLAHITLGWCAIEANDIPSAKAAALAAHAIDAKSKEVHLLLFQVYYYGKEYQRAAEISEQLLELDRRLGRAYYELGLAQRALGQTADARANLTRSIDFQGDPNASSDLGFLEMISGNHTRAMKWYNRAVREETFEFLAHYYLGVLHHMQGQMETAGWHWRRSRRMSLELCKANPSDSYAHVVAAMSSAALGDGETALSLVARARELAPKDGLVAYYSACAASWLPDDLHTLSLMVEAKLLPRSPSEVEVSHDPHFLKYAPE